MIAEGACGLCGVGRDDGRCCGASTAVASTIAGGNLCVRHRMAILVGRSDYCGSTLSFRASATNDISR